MYFLPYSTKVISNWQEARSYISHSYYIFEEELQKKQKKTKPNRRRRCLLVLNEDL